MAASTIAIEHQMESEKTIMTKDTSMFHSHEEPKEAIEHTADQQDIPLPENNSLEQWNNPRINIYKYFSALFSFIIMGMNDAAPGVSHMQSK